jgi:hypothetical protein
MRSTAMEFTKCQQLIQFKTGITNSCNTIIQKLIVAELINKFSANLWNPKTRYRVHKSSPFVLVLNQLNPIHFLPFSSLNPLDKEKKGADEIKTKVMRSRRIIRKKEEVE